MKRHVVYKTLSFFLSALIFLSASNGLRNWVFNS